MSCPHSNAPGSSPDTCSQCLMAKARRIEYDPDTRAMRVDGKIVESVATDEKSPPNRGGRVLSRRQRSCGICGASGHTRATCNRQPSTTEGTEAMARDN